MMPVVTHNQYKKLRKEGGTRVLSVGTLVPKSWKLVRVIKEDELIKDDREWVRLRIERVV